MKNLSVLNFRINNEYNLFNKHKRNLGKLVEFLDNYNKNV